MTNKYIKSKLFKNQIFHQRLIPLKHKFKYSVTSLFVFYDELNELHKLINFFSFNKYNIFSFHEKDHGYRDKRSLKIFVEDILNKNSIKYKNLRIGILCFPRIFGYVFNPLSIFFCYESEKLIAILYEVKNTSSEQHTYCFMNNSPSPETSFNHSCKKNFYVSPFIEMNCLYKFITKVPDSTFSVIIEQFNNKMEKILIATQTGKEIKFTSATILKSFFNNPLMTFKVFLGIHYEAIKIFFKGGKFYSRKKKPIDTISLEGEL